MPSLRDILAAAKKAEATQRSLAAPAFGLVVAAGVRGTTIREIAKELGIDPGLACRLLVLHKDQFTTHWIPYKGHHPGDPAQVSLYTAIKQEPSP